jgi:serine O-acetyltransferase
MIAPVLARPDSAKRARPWQDQTPSRPLPFWESLAADVVAHCDPNRYPRGVVGWMLLGLRVAAFSSGFHAVLLYRMAHSLRGWLGWVGRVLAAILFWIGRHWYGCSIASTARLDGGLILPHPQGIVVGREVVVGPRAWIFQNVTLGGTPGKRGMPHIGSDARLYAGAVICGPVVIGDHVTIGANVVASRDLPSRSLLRAAYPILLTHPEPTDAGDA